MILILATVAFVLCIFALFTVLPTLGFMPQLLFTFPLEQIISFRWALAIIFIVLGLIYLLLTILSGGLLRRLIAGITALVLLASGIVHAAELYSDGVYNRETISELFSSQNNDTLRNNLLTCNTESGTVLTAEAMQRIPVKQPNQVLIPEISAK